MTCAKWKCRCRRLQQTLVVWQVTWEACQAATSACQTDVQQLLRNFASSSSGGRPISKVGWGCGSRAMQLAAHQWCWQVLARWGWLLLEQLLLLLLLHGMVDRRWEVSGRNRGQAAAATRGSGRASRAESLWALLSLLLTVRVMAAV
jgi:hypothetical protein